MRLRNMTNKSGCNCGCNLRAMKLQDRLTALLFLAAGHLDAVIIFKDHFHSFLIIQLQYILHIYKVTAMKPYKILSRQPLLEPGEHFCYNQCFTSGKKQFAVIADGFDADERGAIDYLNTLTGGQQESVACGGRLGRHG